MYIYIQFIYNICIYSFIFIEYIFSRCYITTPKETNLWVNVYPLSECMEHHPSGEPHLQ